MAEGGVETPLATGQIEVPGIENAIQQTSVSGLSAPPVPDSGDPLDPAQQGQRPQRTVSVQGPDLGQRYYPRQQDFYPVQDPWQAQTPSGTYPIPTAGQIPFAILAARQQEINRKKEALGAAQKQFDLYSGIDPVKAQYQARFNSLVDKELMGFYDNVVKAYGGDERSAVAELSNPNSELGRQWRRKTRDLNTLGKQSVALVDTATTLLDRIRHNEIRDPDGKMARLSNELLSGNQRLSSDDSFDSSQMLDLANKFTQQATITDVLNQIKIKDIIDHMREQHPETQWDVRGNNIVAITDDVQSADKALDELARDMSRSALSGIPEKEIADALKTYFPVKVERKIQMQGINYPPSSGGGDGSAAAKVPSYGVAVVDRPQSVGPAQGVVGGQSIFPNKGVEVQVSNWQGNRLVPVSMMTVREEDKNGREQLSTIYAPRHVFEGGKWYLEGRSLTDSEKRQFTDKNSALGYTGAELQSAIANEVESSSVGRTVKVPLDQNLAQIRSTTGDNSFGPETLGRIVMQSGDKGAIELVFGKTPTPAASRVFTYNPETDELE